MPTSPGSPSEFAFINFFHPMDVARICASTGRIDLLERLLDRLAPSARREQHGVLKVVTASNDEQVNVGILARGAPPDRPEHCGGNQSLPVQKLQLGQDNLEQPRVAIEERCRNHASIVAARGRWPERI